MRLQFFVKLKCKKALQYYQLAATYSMHDPICEVNFCVTHMGNIV